jgi:hypothetical protein
MYSLLTEAPQETPQILCQDKDEVCYNQEKQFNTLELLCSGLEISDPYAEAVGDAGPQR